MTRFGPRQPILTHEVGYNEGYRTYSSVASLDYHSARSCWRIRYTLRIGAQKSRRALYVKSKAEARSLKGKVEQLEQATRSGIARHVDIEEWIRQGWLSAPRASNAFPGYEETVHRQESTVKTPTDYQAILDAFEQYALDHSKARDPARKTHRNHMSMARQVCSWLQDTAPDIQNLTEEMIREGLREHEARGYAGWTVMHRLTKTRLLLDRAVELGMINANPARAIRRKQPKLAARRRILEDDEIRQLLEISMHYRHWINGGLPTVVRLGLYAGMRDEEMIWAQWTWLNSRRRVLSVQQSVCELTGETWIPKDQEARDLGVKEELVSYLAEEKKRLRIAELLGPFLLPAGGSRRSGFREKPMSENAPQAAFRKMIRAAGMDPAITIYSLRHTYCTMLLRIPDMDLRTVQEMMGHSSIRTTEGYLHPIRAERHPGDGLPY